MKGWVAEREGEVFAIAQQAGKDVTGLLWAQFQVFAVLRVLFQDALGVGQRGLIDFSSQGGPAVFCNRDQRVDQVGPGANVDPPNTWSQRDFSIVIFSQQVGQGVDIVCTSRNGRAEVAGWNIPAFDAIVMHQDGAVKHFDRCRVGKVDAGLAGRRGSQVLAQCRRGGTEGGKIIAVGILVAGMHVIFARKGRVLSHEADKLPCLLVVPTPANIEDCRAGPGFFNLAVHKSRKDGLYRPQRSNRIMIYTLHEMKRAVHAPVNLWAQAMQATFANPFSPWAWGPGSAKVAASSELLMRVIRHYDKPAFGLSETQVGGQAVAVHEQFVDDRPFCRLLHFRREVLRDDPKVLVVAPLSGHHASLLRDTVRALLPEHDVYITDWLDARLVPVAAGDFHFDDYVAYVQAYLRLLGPNVHVLAVCQPTVPVLAAISLLAATGEAGPRSMTLMGGPIDTRICPTAVNEFATRHSMRWFETRVIDRVPAKYPGFGRRVYPGFLQHAGFVSMNQDRHLQAHLDFYNHLVEGDGDSAEAHRRFYDEYNAVMDLPAEFYLETIRRVFKDHELPRGMMKVAGQSVEPALITQTALLTIEGSLDDISSPGQTDAAQDLCSALPETMRQRLLVEGVGHYGIFSGRRWREEIYPQVRDFIRCHAL